MGMLYKRGKVFWIKYYSGGKPVRESTGTSKQTHAKCILKKKNGVAPPTCNRCRASIALPMTN